MNTRLLGVVLCGGRSSRMGRDKAALAHPHGGTFLQHSIDRLTAICDEVVISGNTDLDHGIGLIEDPIPHQGPAVGIAAALRHARDHGFAASLVTPVDTPFLTVNDLLALRQSWLEIGRLTIAASDRIQPLIGIYPTTLTDDVGRLACSADRSLDRWLKSTDHTTFPLPAAACRNINTPDDLPGSK